VLEAASAAALGKRVATGTALVADATCKVRTADIRVDGQRKVSWVSGLGLGGWGLGG
jgi:hypothetical protein